MVFQLPIRSYDFVFLKTYLMCDEKVPPFSFMTVNLVAALFLWFVWIRILFLILNVILSILNVGTLCWKWALRAPSPGIQ